MEPMYGHVKWDLSPLTLTLSPPRGEGICIWVIGRCMTVSDVLGLDLSYRADHCGDGASVGTGVPLSASIFSSSGLRGLTGFLRL